VGDTNVCSYAKASTFTSLYLGVCFPTLELMLLAEKALWAELLLMQRPKRIRSSLRTGSPRPWVPLTKRTRWAVGFVIVALAALVNRRRASPTQNKAHLVRWDSGRSYSPPPGKA
jgi:hypothetical protein